MALSRRKKTAGAALRRRPGVQSRGANGARPSLTDVTRSLNRSMGLGDLYPFVLTAPVVDKLEFIHRAVADARSL